MRECRTYGSVRGALSNERPYRDHIDLPLPLLHRCMACCFKVGFSALPPARSGGGNGTAVL
jgi:hypothetical protein